MNKFSCYNCGKHLSFRLDQIGKRMKCPKCQTEIKIGANKPPSQGTTAGSLLTQQRLVVGTVGILVIGAGVLIWQFCF